MRIFCWWYLAVIGISWIWTYIMLDWFCTGLKTWELNVFCSLFNFVFSYLLICLWVPGISDGCEMFKLRCRHRWGPTMPGLLRPVSYEPKRLKQDQRRMVRKVSVRFGMGHCAMQYINTLVLLHSLLCLWLNIERHQKKFYCCIDGRLPRAGISCATWWK